MRMITKKSLSAIITLALFTTACSSNAASTTNNTNDNAESEVLQISATTTILGSVVSDITECAGISTNTIFNIGADPHTFSLSSQEVSTLAQAILIVSNGLGLEEGILSVLDNLQEDGVEVLEIAPLVNPIEFDEEEHEDHEDEEEHEYHHEGEDPHFWLDVERMSLAAEIIGDRLSEITGDDTFSTCGSEKAENLLELDLEIEEILSNIPSENRQLVTDHDSFGYFAESYNFKIIGTVIPSTSTDAEASSRDLVELIETIEENGTTALFASPQANKATLETVASEVDELEIIELFSGSVSEAEGEAPDYESLVRVNAERIRDALS